MLSTLGHPGWTSEVLLLLLPPALALLRSRFHPRTARMLFLTVTTIVILSGSRGNMLVLVFVGWMSHRLQLISLRFPRDLLIGATFAAVALGLLLHIEAGRLLAWTPLSGRISLWAAGLYLATLHPLTGAGLHHLNLVLPEGLRFLTASIDPTWIPGLPTVLVDRLDNDLLHFLVETGLVSTLLLLIFVSRILMLLWKKIHSSWDSLNAAVFISLIAIFLLSLFSSPLHTPATLLLFWVFSGFASGSVAAPWTGASKNGLRPSRRYRSAIYSGAALVFLFLLVRIALPATRDNRIAGQAHRLLHRAEASAAASILAPLRAPWQPEAAIDRARALVRLHRPAEALDDFEKLGVVAPQAVLGRQAQLDLANYAMSSQRYELAAHAYEGFLRVFETDEYRTQVQMILGLIYARYLHRPRQAAELLRSALEKLDQPDQIQLARRYYNGAVRNYNIRVESFPSNLVARLFGFKRAEFFQIETATERAVPKVEVS